MNADVDIFGVDVIGTGAPPRRNGELVFQAPWESRAFGVAVAMAQAQVFPFEDMRAFLIDEIGRWEQAHDGDDAGWSYYAHWLSALERLLAQRGLLDSAAIGERMRLIDVHESGEHSHG